MVPPGKKVCPMCNALSAIRSFSCKECGHSFYSKASKQALGTHDTHHGTPHVVRSGWWREFLSGWPTGFAGEARGDAKEEGVNDEKAPLKSPPVRRRHAGTPSPPCAYPTVPTFCGREFFYTQTAWAQVAGKRKRKSVLSSLKDMEDENDDDDDDGSEEHNDGAETETEDDESVGEPEGDEEGDGASLKQPSKRKRQPRKRDIGFPARRREDRPL